MCFIFIINGLKRNIYNYKNHDIDMIGKRGQGLSTNAIILIVLGVIILAVLVVGFTIGWGQIAPFISTSNVNAIKIECQNACELESFYDFCLKDREVKAEEYNSPKDASCFILSEDYSNLGIESCPALDSECEDFFSDLKEEENELPKAEESPIVVEVPDPKTED